jgi:hypothetical protein
MEDNLQIQQIRTQVTNHRIIISFDRNELGDGDAGPSTKIETESEGGKEEVEEREVH